MTILIVKRATCDECKTVAEVPAEEELPEAWLTVIVHHGRPNAMRTGVNTLVCSVRCAELAVRREADRLAAMMDRAAKEAGK